MLKGVYVSASFVDGILRAGVSPIMIGLLIVVVVAPFVLPPVKSWKDASTREKFSVAIYAVAVAVVMLYFMFYMEGNW